MFSSGNDLTNFQAAMSSEGFESLEQAAEEGRVLVLRFVQTFISCSKVLIAAVNGDAIGTKNIKRTNVNTNFLFSLLAKVNSNKCCVSIQK